MRFGRHDDAVKFQSDSLEFSMGPSILSGCKTGSGRGPASFWGLLAKPTHLAGKRVNLWDQTRAETRRRAQRIEDEVDAAEETRAACAQVGETD